MAATIISETPKGFRKSEPTRPNQATATVSGVRSANFAILARGFPIYIAALLRYCSFALCDTATFLPSVFAGLAEGLCKAVFSIVGFFFFP
jgi:hypothetical protein